MVVCLKEMLKRWDFCFFGSLSYIVLKKREVYITFVMRPRTRLILDYDTVVDTAAKPIKQRRCEPTTGCGTCIAHAVVST